MEHKPTRIKLEAPANGDYDAAWDKHFEARVKQAAGDKDSVRMMAAFRQDADIRETTRQLMNEQQYKTGRRADPLRPAEWLLAALDVRSAWLSHDCR